MFQVEKVKPFRGPTKLIQTIRADPAERGPLRRCGPVFQMTRLRILEVKTFSHWLSSEQICFSFQVEDHQVGGGHVDLDVDPFSANVGNAVAAVDDDLLSSAADTNSMEAGDEQYKSLIAESQMDNIFN